MKSPTSTVFSVPSEKPTATLKGLTYFADVMEITIGLDPLCSHAYNRNRLGDIFLLIGICLLLPSVVAAPCAGLQLQANKLLLAGTRHGHYTVFMNFYSGVVKMNVRMM